MDFNSQTVPRAYRRETTNDIQVSIPWNEIGVQLKGVSPAGKNWGWILVNDVDEVPTGGTTADGCWEAR